MPKAMRTRLNPVEYKLGLYLGDKMHAYQGERHFQSGPGKQHACRIAALAEIATAKLLNVYPATEFQVNRWDLLCWRGKVDVKSMCKLPPEVDHLMVHEKQYHPDLVAAYCLTLPLGWNKHGLAHEFILMGWWDPTDTHRAELYETRNNGRSWRVRVNHLYPGETL